MKLPMMLVQSLSAFLFCNLVLSCKKGNNNPSSCHIISATLVSSQGTASINFTYNNDKKISTLSMSGATTLNKVFNYNGNTIIVNTTTTGGAFEGRDSVTLDGRGRPINIRHFYNQGGTSWHNTAYEYSGDDMVKFMQGYESDNILDTYTVNSTAGNVVYWGNSGNSTSLDYYSEKNIQPGDYLSFEAMMQYGVNIYPHKNLVKQLESTGGYYTNLNYEFDSGGKITKVTVTSNFNVITFTYQYQCN